MQIIYAQEEFPTTVVKTIYLAGPSPRDPNHPNWREEALEILKQNSYDGCVFVPLPRDGQFSDSYQKQADWEQSAISRSDIVLFWVPRNLETLPGFTTNVEFGQKVQGRNVVLGHPQNAPKTRFLSYLAQRNFVEYAETLQQTLELALEKIGKGAYRSGGECEVPLFLWNLPHFKSWLQAQKKAGNRLDGCKVELTFGVGPKKAFLLYWAAHVDIHVEKEQRNKSNEIVIGRPDIKHVVGFCPSVNLLDTQIVLIREFRSTSCTEDGFIREVPGGSGFKPGTPKEDAAKEFLEETGIKISPNRLINLGTRQVSGTTTCHQAHVFAVKLTPDEIRLAMEKAGQAYGNESETERTYVEVYTVVELLKSPITDWSNLGMVFAATAL